MAKISRRVSYREFAKDKFEEVVVKVNRCATVVKGGRRFSFSAIVVIGNKNGVAGIGFGKANEVPPAVEKAVKNAQKNLFHFPILNDSVPHEILGHFGASRVKLIPAFPGTGIIAGGTVRALMEMAGYKDILTKAYGSTNPSNLIKAALDGLMNLRTKEEVSQLRGVSV
ncbi:MAG: 30S ribosomal protein S5 [Planctomycetota bacterium]